ncbi:hypothetical protein LCGC14_2145340, partial [marine sediment metagenome]
GGMRIPRRMRFSSSTEIDNISIFPAELRKKGFTEKIVLVLSSAFRTFIQFFPRFFPLSPVKSIVDFIVTNGNMIL